VAALALLAFGLTVAFLAAAPPAPFADDVPLPLLVLAGGALATVAQWRRQVSITPDEVIVRTLARARRLPLRAVTGVEADDDRVTIQLLDGRKAVVRAVAGPDEADDLAAAVVAAAGPQARLADDLADEPVPMLTPWLISLLLACVAFLAAVALAPHQELVQHPAATATTAQPGPAPSGR
jgi:hypothetical protein